MYVGEQQQDPPEDIDPLEHCGECNKKLEGEEQQWFCSKACESKHLDNLRSEDDKYARAMIEELEICKGLFQGRV